MGRIIYDPNVKTIEYLASNPNIIVTGSGTNVTANGSNAITIGSKYANGTVVSIDANKGIEVQKSDGSTQWIPYGVSDRLIPYLNGDSVDIKAAVKAGITDIQDYSGLGITQEQLNNVKKALEEERRVTVTITETQPQVEIQQAEPEETLTVSRHQGGVKASGNIFSPSLGGSSRTKGTVTNTTASEPQTQTETVYEITRNVDHSDEINNLNSQLNEYNNQTAAAQANLDSINQAATTAYNEMQNIGKQVQALAKPKTAEEIAKRDALVEQFKTVNDRYNSLNGQIAGAESALNDAVAKQSAASNSINSQINTLLKDTQTVKISEKEAKEYSDASAALTAKYGDNVSYVDVINGGDSDLLKKVGVSSGTINYIKDQIDIQAKNQAEYDQSIENWANQFTNATAKQKEELINYAKNGGDIQKFTDDYNKAQQRNQERQINSYIATLPAEIQTAASKAYDKLGVNGLNAYLVEKQLDNLNVSDSLKNKIITIARDGGDVQGFVNSITTYQVDNNKIKQLPEEIKTNKKITAKDVIEPIINFGNPVYYYKQALERAPKVNNYLQKELAKTEANSKNNPLIDFFNNNIVEAATEDIVRRTAKTDRQGAAWISDDEGYVTTWLKNNPVTEPVINAANKVFDGDISAWLRNNPVTEAGIRFLNKTWDELTWHTLEGAGIILGTVGSGVVNAIDGNVKRGALDVGSAAWGLITYPLTLPSTFKNSIAQGFAELASIILPIKTVKTIGLKALNRISPKGISTNMIFTGYGTGRIPVAEGKIFTPKNNASFDTTNLGKLVSEYKSDALTKDRTDNLKYKSEKLDVKKYNDGNTTTIVVDPGNHKTWDKELSKLAAYEFDNAITEGAGNQNVHLIMGNLSLEGNKLGFIGELGADEFTYSFHTTPDVNPFNGTAKLEAGETGLFLAPSAKERFVESSARGYGEGGRAGVLMTIDKTGNVGYSSIQTDQHKWNQNLVEQGVYGPGLTYHGEIEMQTFASPGLQYNKVKRSLLDKIEMPFGGNYWTLSPSGEYIPIIVTYRDGVNVKSALPSVADIYKAKIAADRLAIKYFINNIKNRKLLNPESSVLSTVNQLDVKAEIAKFEDEFDKTAKTKLEENKKTNKNNPSEEIKKIDLEKTEQEIQDKLQNISKLAENDENIKNTVNETIEKLKKTNVSNYEDVIKDLDNQIKAEKIEVVKQLIVNTKDVAIKIKDATNFTIVKKVKNAASKINDRLTKKAQESIDKLDNADTVKEINEANNELNEVIESENTAVVESINSHEEAIKELNEDIENAAKENDTAKVEQSQEKLNKLLDELKELQTIIQELKQLREISKDVKRIYRLSKDLRDLHGLSKELNTINKSIDQQTRIIQKMYDLANKMEAADNNNNRALAKAYADEILKTSDQLDKINKYNDQEKVYAYEQTMRDLHDKYMKKSKKSFPEIEKYYSDNRYRKEFDKYYNKAHRAAFDYVTRAELYRKSKTTTDNRRTARTKVDDTSRVDRVTRVATEEVTRRESPRIDNNDYRTDRVIARTQLDYTDRAIPRKTKSRDEIPERVEVKTKEKAVPKIKAKEKKKPTETENNEDNKPNNIGKNGKVSWRQGSLKVNGKLKPVWITIESKNGKVTKSYSFSKPNEAHTSGKTPDQTAYTAGNNYPTGTFELGAVKVNVKPSETGAEILDFEPNKRVYKASITDKEPKNKMYTEDIQMTEKGPIIKRKRV